MRTALAYGAMAVTFFALDFLWLSLTAERIYRPAIGSLMTDKLRIGPALAFYLVYLTGVFVFAVRPGLKAGEWSTAALYGALFGLVAYATYDLTNMATLKVWPLKVTLLDLGWGAFATAVAAAAGTWAACAVIKS